jgi:uncharacterized repeat protein (TIGR03987 family)
MSPTLIAAVVTILTAAVIYTIAVFAEQRSGVLKPWHLALFWLGLVFDTTGTTLMSDIAGGWKLNIHGALGVLAIVLMLIHAGWATIALVFKQEAVLSKFHTFSVHVWGLWMASLVSGIALNFGAMTGGGLKTTSSLGSQFALLGGGSGVCPLKLAGITHG